MSAIDTLLGRLEGVRKSGQQKWMTRCPAHKDGSPSLAIRHADDGRILIHCFAGCEALAVLDAVGMDIRDLFPERITHHAAPKKFGVSPQDVMLAMRHETLVIAFIAESIAEGVTDEPLCRRAQQAASRIRTALELCDG